MKHIPIIIALVLAGAALRADDITTLSGKKFIGVTISRAEPNGLVVMTSDGIEKIPFTDLSPELRAKYGYDPKKAAQFNSAVQAAATQRAAEARAVAAASAAADSQAAKDASTAKANPPVRIWGEVETAQTDGLIVDSRAQDGSIKARAIGWDGGPPRGPDRPRSDAQGIYFLTGHPQNDKVVDHDSFDVDAVEVGTYSYAGGKIKQYRIIRVYKKPW